MLAANESVGAAIIFGHGRRDSSVTRKSRKGRACVVDGNGKKITEAETVRAHPALGLGGAVAEPKS